MSLQRPSACTADRGGFSLLEVLVACAILVFALATIASILPAAGARLGEASAQDRAAAAAEVAMSELRSRNLVARDIFPTGSSAVAPAVVLGEMLPLSLLNATVASSVTNGYLPTGVLTANGSGTTTGTNVVTGSLAYGTFGSLAFPVSSVVNSRINNDINTANAWRRGYFLEDEVQYGPPQSSSGQPWGGLLPENQFSNQATRNAAGTGPRRFARNTCWAAMITPQPWGVTTGNMKAARVNVAVFRKPGAVAAMQLTGAAGVGGIFTTTGTRGPALQKTFLKPCGWVLAIPPSANNAPPQWLQVRSSWVVLRTQTTSVITATGTGGTPVLTPWILSGSGTAQAQLIFSGSIPASLMSGSFLTVLGFENLLLVTEQIQTIE